MLSDGIHVRSRRGGTQKVGTVFLSSHWHTILAQCVVTVLLFSVLARYSCSVAVFMNEGGAGQTKKVGRGTLV